MTKQEKKEPSLRFPEFEGVWSKKKLSDIGKIITGSTPSTSQPEYYGGDKQFVSPADIQGNRYVKSTKTTLTNLGFSKGRMIKANSILFVCIGSTIGKIAQAHEDCVSNQQINSITANQNNANGFVLSALEGKAPKIKLLAGIQAVPQINKTDFSNLHFLFPLLPEQQKIADFLTAVDKRIAQLEEKKRLLTEYKKGVMRQIFSQQIRFTDQGGNPYPDWEEKRLGDVGTFKSGTGFSEKEQGGKEGVPFYKVSDMNLSGNEKEMTRANNYVSDKQIEELRFKVINKASIIFAKVGAAIFLERKRIANTFLIDNNMMAFTPDFNIHFAKFLYETIRLSKFAQVGALPSYNASDLKTIKISIPSKSEQQKIADFLTSIDNKTEQVGAQFEQAKTFKKGLLQQMFV